MKLPSFSTSALLVLAIAAKYVDAGVAITGPLGNAWPAGSTHIITWTDNGDGSPMPATFNIDLMSGPLTALQLVGPIAPNTDSAAGQYSWSIPATIPPGKEYAIRFGSPPNVAYSPYFEITAAGTDGGAGNGAAPAGSSSASGTPSAASTSATNSATAASAPAAASGSSKPSSTLSVAGAKPSTGQVASAKQSSGNSQAIIPSLGLALVFSLITFFS
ncbi:hypothetical protein K493DRAFT_248596 [Basidiobolus meristosporus CBS 931.73]|uniref:Yeast cell wall synthesis Kre9/Knh1-like N-terminal domain-containing protein n=1 Tax=Basidiobolus meristosporus CBS 931.73 TaxID=1314790 RepID=A0A1Y1VXN2_9FUNG|nr:hypothetical protein K493DRAFT_248596 [Basidiobolus meristosporus CBS 931.73]|eukprot:ORX65554.1 hypothetical protein K493DRAFT_248596 [Basidiobolus meristosporus CBS 931.73]